MHNHQLMCQKNHYFAKCNSHICMTYQKVGQRHRQDLHMFRPPGRLHRSFLLRHRSDYSLNNNDNHLAKKSRQTFLKRAKEKTRQERKGEKEARRADARERKASLPPRTKARKIRTSPASFQAPNPCRPSSTTESPCSTLALSAPPFGPGDPAHRGAPIW